MATERSTISFIAGQYVEGQYDFELAEYWPIIEGEEPTANHLEDLRKLLFLLYHPGAGYYDVPSDQSLYDVDSLIAAYDPADGDEIGIAWGQEISWGDPVRKWICVARDRHETAPGSGDYRFGMNKRNAWSSNVSWYGTAPDFTDGHKPPEHINPSKDEWHTHNDYWVLAPDFNYYSECNKYSPVYEAVQDRPAGGINTYLYLAHAKEKLPEQVNPLITHDAKDDNSRGGKSKNSVTYDSERLPNTAVENDFSRFYHEMKEIERRHITQIESLGPVRTVGWLGKDSSNNIATNYVRKAGQFDGNFPNGDPINPVVGGNNVDYPQYIFEPKLCAAYQNQIVFMLEMLGGIIALPVNNTYEKNHIEYGYWKQIITSIEEEHILDIAENQYPSLGEVWQYQAQLFECVEEYTSAFDDYGDLPSGPEWENTDKWRRVTIDRWNPLVFYDQENWAKIDDPFWGCNESGFECMLNYTGNYDWWFDTETPYFPKYILFERRKWVGGYLFPTNNKHREYDSPQGPAYDLYFDNWNSDEMNTMWPKPIGTWRRCFRNCFGRIDRREAIDYSDEINGIDYKALTKTLMRPGGGDEPVPEGTAFKNLRPEILGEIYSTHWYGNHDPPNVESWATFEAVGYPIPWPGSWNGNNKTELWVGHNWDNSPDTVRPTHLPYFDGNGETYDQYIDPRNDSEKLPTSDGRPTFDFEELSSGSKFDAFNEMFLRHDPVQIVDDTAHYEIRGDMLNDMREMLLASRSHIVIVNPIEYKNGGYGRLDNYTNMISVDSYATYMWNLIHSEGKMNLHPSEWNDASIGSGPFDGTVVGKGLGVFYNSGIPSWGAISDEFFRESIDSFEHNTEQEHCCNYETHVAISLQGFKEAGMLTTSSVRVRISYWSANEFKFDDTPPHQQAQDCEIEIRVGGNPVPEKKFTIIFDSPVVKTYIDIDSPVIEDLDEDEKLWIRAMCVDEDWVPAVEGNFETTEKYSEGHVLFESDMQVILEFDWNKIPDSVFDTPNDKGLKQRETV